MPDRLFVRKKDREKLLKILEVLWKEDRGDPSLDVSTPMRAYITAALHVLVIVDAVTARQKEVKHGV